MRGDGGGGTDGWRLCDGFCGEALENGIVEWSFLASGITMRWVRGAFVVMLYEVNIIPRPSIRYARYSLQTPNFALIQSSQHPRLHTRFSIPSLTSPPHLASRSSPTSLLNLQHAET